MVTRSTMMTITTRVLIYQVNDLRNSFALNAHKTNNTFVKRKIPHYTLKALYIGSHV